MISMNWGTIKILLAFATIIAVTLFFVLYMSNNFINERQVLAQQIDMRTNITNSSATNGNISKAPTSNPGQSIFYRGIEASEDLFI